MGGTDPLSIEDLRYLTVDSFNEAARKLIDNYNNEPTLMVGLTFTQDNTRVENATPILAGRVDKMKFDANKYWTFTRRLEIVIKRLDLKVFNFTNTLPFLFHVDWIFFSCLSIRLCLAISAFFFVKCSLI